MGVISKRLFNLKRNQAIPPKVLLDCVVEDSESAKQKTTKWQPGSAQAQLGIKSSDKKNLWGLVNYHFWHRCQH